MEKLFKTYYESPIGRLIISGTENSINSVFYDDDKGIKENNNCSNKYLDICIEQLEQYFSSQREVFDIRLEPKGSVFQKKVWNDC